MFPSRMTRGILCCRHGIAARAREASFVSRQRKEHMAYDQERMAISYTLLAIRSYPQRAMSHEEGALGDCNELS